MRAELKAKDLVNVQEEIISETPEKELPNRKDKQKQESIFETKADRKIKVKKIVWKKGKYNLFGLPKKETI